MSGRLGITILSIFIGIALVVGLLIGGTAYMLGASWPWVLGSVITPPIAYFLYIYFN